MNDTSRIDVMIELKAPIKRVWEAVANYREFGQWFGVNLQEAFTAGKHVRGIITHPGYEHLSLEIEIVAVEPEKTFSYRWHPYAIDPSADYSRETPTLVEFRLETAGEGTKLRITESGFNLIPAGRREEAYRMNCRGWDSQLKNIEKHVTGGA